MKCLYDIIVFYSDDDKRYIADIPQLNFGGSFGETPEEALNNLDIAFGYYLEDMKNLGLELPKPINRGAEILTTYYREQLVV